MRALIIAGSLLVPAMAQMPSGLRTAIDRTCLGCHSGAAAKGGLDFASLSFDLSNRVTRERWVRVHDRLAKGEMPPKGVELAAGDRAAMLLQLAPLLHRADLADVTKNGRGPMRRLNRDEYEQDLRDILQLPYLDIRDMLPEDREAHHFNKVSETLDMSRVQLGAYLDASEAALRQAIATAPGPPAVTKFRASGTNLFPGFRSTGTMQSMYFIKDNKGVNVDEERWTPLPKELSESLEMGLFRSPGWPYGAFPRGFAAKAAGEYRVRFSARAVLQHTGYAVSDAEHAVPMTFRSRRPTNHDIAEDVKSVGGILEIHRSEGLRNGGAVDRGPDGGVRTSRAAGAAGGRRGEDGIVPLSAAAGGRTAGGRVPVARDRRADSCGDVAPASHRVLFDELGVSPAPAEPKREASRLLRRFLHLVARGAVPETAVRRFEQLVFARLDRGESFSEAMLAGYQAVLCSDLFLYLREPNDNFAIADRLAHFLTNSGPDAQLVESRVREPGGLRRETDRLIESAGFERFVKNFTAYWLNLRHLRRDDPDKRLYPEYQLDEYLIDSLERETLAFVTAMVRENLPVRNLVDADFLYVNERLARHYDLESVYGAAMRRIRVPR